MIGLKTCKLVAVPAMVAAMALSAPPVHSQDFQVLLKAVKGVETRLETLVQEEVAVRERQMIALEERLNGAYRTGSAVNNDAELSEVVADVAQLHTRMEHLTAAGAADGAAASSLSEKIAALKTEQGVMRERLRVLQDARVDHGPYLADAEGGAYQPPAPLIGAPLLETIQEISYGDLEISGFFDAYGNMRHASDDHTHWDLGQAEIDLETAVSERIGVGVAVAYNSEVGVFELGAATVDFTLYESEETFLSSVGITAGQFDVPFGIDYEVYASPDRRLVTTPRVVDLTHLGWNDFGFIFGLESQFGNWTAYVVNGFESSAEVLDELAADDEEPEEIDTSPANAFGTRLGVAPIPGVSMQVGSSWALGLNHSGAVEMWLGGADFQLAFSDFEFKGEYIYHSLNRSVEKASNRGYYIQGLYNLRDRVFFVGRYGSFKPEGEEWTVELSGGIDGRMPYNSFVANGAQWIGQFSIGAGYKLADGVELRLETLINEDSAENQEIFQVVASF